MTYVLDPIEPAPEPGGVRAEQIPQPDAAAYSEAADFAEQRLSARKRDETLRRHVHCASLIGFWFVFTIAIVGVGIWAFHLFAPLKWHFLQDQQERELQTLVIAAIGSSLLTDYGRRLLNKLDSPGSNA